MKRGSKFETEIISKDRATDDLSALRRRGNPGRTSKFDPLKQHIQWLDRGRALRIQEMDKADVPKLRDYIARNVTPLSKGQEFIVRSSRIDDDGRKYRVFVFREEA